jgi:hypothetical protein
MMTSSGGWWRFREIRNERTAKGKVTRSVILRADRFDVIRYEMLAVLTENSVRSGSNCNVLLRPESDQAWKLPILSSSRSLSSSTRKLLAGGSVADHPGMDDRQLDRHCFSELADDELSRGGIGCIELSSRRRDDGRTGVRRYRYRVRDIEPRYRL